MNEEDPVAQFRNRLRGKADELRRVLDTVPPTGDVAETENPAAARAKNAALSTLFKSNANLASFVDSRAKAIKPGQPPVVGIPE
jgi:hypothetical protein